MKKECKYAFAARCVFGMYVHKLMTIDVSFLICFHSASQTAVWECTDVLDPPPHAINAYSLMMNTYFWTSTVEVRKAFIVDNMPNQSEF